MLALVLVIAFIPLLLLPLLIGLRLFWEARAKGYRSPVPAILLTAAGLVPILGMGAVGLAVSGRHLGDAEQVVLMIGTFGLLDVLVLVIASVVVHRLPRRRPQVRRRARMPFRSLGVLVAMLTVALAVLEARSGNVATTGRIAVLGLTLSAACMWTAQRTRQRSLGDVVADDDRPPVLYLRSFGDDLRPTVLLPRMPDDAGVSGNLLGNYLRMATFDEFLRPAVTAALGPLIALGDPADYLAPRGAARAYAADAGWRDELSLLVRRSQCLVATPGTADGLVWEFDRVKQLGCTDKLYVLTAPAARNRWYARAIRWQYRLGGITPVEWRDFANAVADAGYDVGPDPGPGAVLAFSADGTAVALRRGMRTAEDYVEEISRRAGRAEIAR